MARVQVATADGALPENTREVQSTYPGGVNPRNGFAVQCALVLLFRNVFDGPSPLLFATILAVYAVARQSCSKEGLGEVVLANRLGGQLLSVEARVCAGQVWRGGTSTCEVFRKTGEGLADPL